MNPANDRVALQLAFQQLIYDCAPENLEAVVNVRILQQWNPDGIRLAECGYNQ